jgi:hypothetical protein
MAVSIAGATRISSKAIISKLKLQVQWPRPWQSVQADFSGAQDHAHNSFLALVGEQMEM